MDDRAGRDHLRKQHGLARQQPMEEPAMPVRPFHHGRHAETARYVLGRALHEHEMAQNTPGGKTGWFSTAIATAPI